MDDGKANALSLDMFSELGAAFDRAEADGAGVVLAGREGRFSAGFDLKVMGTAHSDAPALLRAGFETSHRMLSFPLPIVIACTGHAMAMGSFLLLSGDHRFGIAGGDFKVTANEVAIGMTMPRAAIEILRQRLTRTHFDRAVILAEVFTPDSAVAAGFLDTVVPAEELLETAHRKAVSLMSLDLRAHVATKLRARAATLDALRVAIEADDVDMRAMVAAHS
jgi:enoyl-CoA hydratase